LKNHFSDSEIPFNLKYFAFLDEYYMNVVFKDTFTSEKLKKIKAKS